MVKKKEDKKMKKINGEKTLLTLNYVKSFEYGFFNISLWLVGYPEIEFTNKRIILKPIGLKNSLWYKSKDYVKYGNKILDTYIKDCNSGKGWFFGDFISIKIKSLIYFRYKFYTNKNKEIEKIIIKNL